MLQVMAALWARLTLPRTVLWETQWGQLDGRRWLRRACSRRSAGGRASLLTPLPCNKNSASSRGLRALSSRPSGGLEVPVQDSYLVDSASSHMLVSKIKPCMSKYKQFIP